MTATVRAKIREAIDLAWEIDLVPSHALARVLARAVVDVQVLDDAFERASRIAWNYVLDHEDRAKAERIVTLITEAQAELKVEAVGS